MCVCVFLWFWFLCLPHSTLPLLSPRPLGKLRRRQFYSQPLENGRVLSQGSTFTYQDVLDELLVYTPDGLGLRTDEVRFSVTDGVHTESGRLEFTMDVSKSETPRVTINRGLQIAAGKVHVTPWSMQYTPLYPFSLWSERLLECTISMY